MRWMKPNLRGSIHALLGHAAEPSADGTHHRMDEIRRAMLDLLGDRGLADYPGFVRRVRFAADLQTLWYARSDLMGALATLYGEARAREQLEPITDMFRGLIPEALYGRPPRREPR